jgi:hypothetical protein
MRIRQKDSTTYAGILHYAELSWGTSRRVARAGPAACQGLGTWIMSIAGGNTTNDPINHREFVAANESGEGEYRDKRRTEEHLGAGGLGKGPSSLRALYCKQLFPGPATWDNSQA